MRDGQNTGSAAPPQSAAAASGYLHERYAGSLAEFGRPLRLPRSAGWILERDIPGSADRDAIGCYPLFACRDWSALGEDLEAIGPDLVTLTAVTDPFGDYDEALLRGAFPDRMVPFKQHYVVDLDAPQLSKHHRRAVRAAFNVLQVDDVTGRADFLDQWLALHGHLRARHELRGVRAFSARSFALQFDTPGFHVLRASEDGVVIAAMTFVLQQEVLHGHVQGTSPRGYQLGAQYALIASAIERFRGVARWLNLMGVPGDRDRGADTIREFKLGWTRDSRPSYLCGRILNRGRYAALVAAAGADAESSTYFPAYRHGELV